MDAFGSALEQEPFWFKHIRIRSYEVGAMNRFLGRLTLWALLAPLSSAAKYIIGQEERAGAYEVVFDEEKTALDLSKDCYPGKVCPPVVIMVGRQVGTIEVSNCHEGVMYTFVNKGDLIYCMGVSVNVQVLRPVDLEFLASGEGCWRRRAARRRSVWFQGYPAVWCRNLLLLPRREPDVRLMPLRSIGLLQTAKHASPAVKGKFEDAAFTRRRQS
eukprot:s21_g19.t1